MALNAFFLFLLWTAPVFSGYIFEPQKMNWMMAENSCKQNQTYLAVISSQTDLELAVETVGSYSEKVWIGLKRKTQTSDDSRSSSSSTWVWTNDEEAQTFFWAGNQPDSTQEEYVAMMDGKWYDEMEGNNYASLCFVFSSGGSGGSSSSVTAPPATQPPTTLPPVDLRADTLTWEEALDSCKKTGKNLALAKDSTSLERIVQELKRRGVELVWMGLHFFAGEWLRMDGLRMESLGLQSCPQPGMGCGALRVPVSSDFTYIWTDQQCSAKFQFVCE